MAADLGALVQGLTREVPGVEGALVLGPDGRVLAQAWAEESAGAGAAAGACAALAAQIALLAGVGELGGPRRLSVHAEGGQLVLARAAGGLTVGVLAGPAALGGQVRRHLDGVLALLEQA